MLAFLLAALAGAPVAIHVDTAHKIQEIRPLRALGTSVDSDPKGKIALLYSPRRVTLMLSTGLGTLTYRLYTELSVQDWHWNPSGAFSDRAHHQGYWTSSASLGEPIADSFGYHLTHRGSSRDQGQDDNYSRIDDGDPHTYWKSNPYLTHRFTHESDAMNPQWVVAQFVRPQSVNAVRITWTNPYATRFDVQYWIGHGDAVVEQDSGIWRTFPKGHIAGARGGSRIIRVSGLPVTTAAVRILMSESSNTCDDHGAGDVRNCAGYAIEDLAVGRIVNDGFHDLVVRGKNGSCGGMVYCKPDPRRQTLMWTSSTDPWHTARDKVTNDQDQPGLDIVTRSGVTRALPTIYPVPLFYSTPQNAANEVRYLEARGYPIAYIEMGEEVDGQYALPEDYAALYVQFAAAIHAVDPRVKLGGPVFEGVPKDVPAWRNANGDTSWLHRFITYLRRRGRLRDFAFMSWEHYPYHNCDRGAKLRADLLDEPSFVRRIVAQWRLDGVPRSVPLLETEDNFSADGTGAPQRVYGALWLADFIGASLASGVSYATYYQAETEPLEYNKRCNAWGAYNPYIVDRHFTVRAKGAAYYAQQLLTREWVVPGDLRHGVYPVTTSVGQRNAPLTSYAVHRPDGMWSVLIVNKDAQPRRVSVDFGSPTRSFKGIVHTARFGAGEYRWNGKGPDDVPNPATGIRYAAGPASSTYTIPAQTVMVLRGRITSSAR